MKYIVLLRGINISGKNKISMHEIYKHLGFIDTDTEQCFKGLRFYPMKKDIERQ